jgi:hypothetical protein
MLPFTHIYARNIYLIEMQVSTQVIPHDEGP